MRTFKYRAKDNHHPK